MARALAIWNKNLNHTQKSSFPTFSGIVTAKSNLEMFGESSPTVRTPSVREGMQGHRRGEGPGGEGSPSSALGLSVNPKNKHPPGQGKKRRHLDKTLFYSNV